MYTVAAEVDEEVVVAGEAVEAVGLAVDSVEVVVEDTSHLMTRLYSFCIICRLSLVFQKM
jgi:hypothetical protein